MSTFDIDAGFAAATTEALLVLLDGARMPLKPRRIGIGDQRWNGVMDYIELGGVLRREPARLEG